MKPEFENHLPIDAATRDKTSPVWDMSQERVFMETLLNQRFNFLTVLFCFSLAGALNAKSQIHFQWLLFVGAVCCAAFSTVLERAQRKLDIILDDLNSDASHPVAIVNKRIGSGGSRRRLVGIWMPRLFVAVLGSAAVLAFSGHLVIAKLGHTVP